LLPDNLILDSVPWRDYQGESLTGDIKHPADFKDKAAKFLIGEENRLGGKLCFTWDSDFRILPNSLTLGAG